MGLLDVMLKSFMRYTCSCTCTNFVCADKDDVPAISLSTFEDHVCEMHKDDDKGFKEEYGKVNPPPPPRLPVVITLSVHSFLSQIGLVYSMQPHFPTTSPKTDILIYFLVSFFFNFPFSI